MQTYGIQVLWMLPLGCKGKSGRHQLHQEYWLIVFLSYDAFSFSISVKWNWKNCMDLGKGLEDLVLVILQVLEIFSEALRS